MSLYSPAQMKRIIAEEKLLGYNDSLDDLIDSFAKVTHWSEYIDYSRKIEARIEYMHSKYKENHLSGDCLDFYTHWYTRVSSNLLVTREWYDKYGK